MAGRGIGRGRGKGGPFNVGFDDVSQKSIDQYWMYTRLVGGDMYDEEGREKLMSEEELCKYMKEKLPQRLENRLFTSWSSSTGMDCKEIGPETPCFCQHRYKQHKTDFEKIPSERPILLPCKVKNCKCAAYHYVPMSGGQTIRCSACKHPASDHSAKEPYPCKKQNCQKCPGFKSSYSCGCGEPYYNHRMIVETKSERLARGHPIGQDVPFAAMGGLTGFSSNLDGYQRMDPSGRGAPNKEFLEQDITCQDDAFLRAHVNSLQAKRNANMLVDDLGGEIEEQASAMKKEGESDMEFFERRYKERRKRELWNIAPQDPNSSSITTGVRHQRATEIQVGDIMPGPNPTGRNPPKSARGRGKKF